MSAMHSRSNEMNLIGTSLHAKLIRTAAGGLTEPPFCCQMPFELFLRSYADPNEIIPAPRIQPVHRPALFINCQAKHGRREHCTKMGTFRAETRKRDRLR